ncbi:MAG TPA: FHA domain-containing protein [Thermoanaerobaculia bacterium]|nr:FHA domain-containing protein [Thermoanaerobaculia bacterium]
MVAWAGFVLQRISPGGITLTEVTSPSLRIGRGTNSELRSDNPAVALEHAVITADDSGYTISDRGSVTGTYVDGRTIESTRLTKGSVIEIGDLRITVQIAEPGQPLFLTIASSGVPISSRFEEEERETPAQVEESGWLLRWPRTDFAAAYRLGRPYLTKITIAAVLAGLALAIVGEVTRPGKQAAFMPGGVSSAHVRARNSEGQLIAERCDACHEPWGGIPNTKCLACHPRAEHSVIEKDPPACGDCHSEHRGVAKLAAAADSTCISCHSNLTAHVLPGKHPAIPVSISRFGQDHPQFDVEPLPEAGGTIPFSHKHHLQPGGLLNGHGQRETLRCASCHAMVETRGGLDPEPLQFEKHCQRCHRLTFDERFPDADIPHGGDPGLAYGFVIATYSGNRDLFTRPPEQIRRMLAARAETPADARAVLAAEQVIKKKCTQCHAIESFDNQLTVDPPIWRTRWIEGADFSHAKHRNVECQACHRAGTSGKATDTLMPVREDCARCHGGEPAVKLAGAAMPRLASSCVTCHRYHARATNLLTQTPAARQGRQGADQSLFGRGQEMFGSILLAVIVLLVLVVLVPVTIALIVKIRRRDEKRVAVQGTPAGAVTPTMKIPPLQPEQPRPVVPPPPGATEQVKLDKVATSPGGTEMIQWNGLLVCISGPLEGQKFMIEDDGLYIGRDPALSSVVINDSRVSKRHVRIFPRDGKVWAIDQNSTNGTFLASAPQERITEVQLKGGMEFIIGDDVARFRYQI